MHGNMAGGQRDYDDKPMELCLTQYFPNFLAHGTFLRAGFTSIISAFTAHGGGSTGPRRHRGIW